MTDTTQRTTYLARRLAVLAAGHYPPAWGQKYATEALSSPMAATTPADARDFGLLTDAYAAPLSTSEMTLVGTLRRISRRDPATYTGAQMRARANEVLGMNLASMSEWDRLVIKALGGPSAGTSAVAPKRGRQLAT